MLPKADRATARLRGLVSRTASACARAAVAGGFMLAGCGSGDAPAEPPASAPAPAALPAPLDRAALRTRAAAIFGALPAEVPHPTILSSPAKIDLGRQLYYDTRLSKNHDISCNSCHPLDRAGADGQPTSAGHKGQRGARNSPSVYNAALQVAQFWDGRAADLEEQAKGPVLNAVEMGMPDADYVLEVLRSIPGYRASFTAAFPGGGETITFDNMAVAIAAFERKLMTPGPFDAFLAGDASALTDPQLEGLQAFIETGCITCHQGRAVGGAMFQKLGLVKPLATEDPGRFEVTGNENDRGVFKVPSLRNVASTAPYFHDGSVATLDEAIRLMAEHQLGVSLRPERVTAIREFLGALDGSVDAAYIASPQLPESGPDTPAPDPS